MKTDADFAGFVRCERCGGWYNDTPPGIYVDVDSLTVKLCECDEEDAIDSRDRLDD